MDGGFAVAVGLAVVFAATNGIHDASNAIATLVATRSATPRQAITLATAANLVGPLVLGGAVASTIGGIVPAGAGTTAIIGAGLAAATTWNLLTWWRGLPSSSGHALVGGLVGAALADGGGGAINWGGVEGGRPTGVIGTLVALGVAPVLGVVAALLVVRILRIAGRRATRRWTAGARAGQWGTSAALAFSHGANDAQKSVGVIAALLVADGRATQLGSPTWAELVCAAALTLGTALGGWSIVRTVGRRIFRIRASDGLAAQGASAGVIFGASLAGAPVSTTHVVASAVVGTGGGRRRWRHVHWAVVRSMALAWAVTLPACALLGAGAHVAWVAVA